MDFTSINAITQKFNERPARLPVYYYRFFVLTNYIYFLALIVHASLILVFALLGQNSLAIFNVGSCLLFMVAIRLNFKGYIVPSSALVTFEIVAHAIFCVMTLGWASGFHYYILGVMVTFFSAPWKKVSYKIAMASGVAVIYVLLYYYASISVPFKPLLPITQNIVNVTNVLVFIVVISIALYASQEAAVKASEQLARAMEQIKSSQLETEKKNKELAKKNAELMDLSKRADRIFSAFTEALPGTILDGKYRIDEMIGAGGFGAVYRGTHIAMKRKIAVKVFRPTAGNDSIENLQRFQQEAVAACRVHHPNAVAVLDSGISSGKIAYMVMELLEGYSLTHEIREKGALSIKRCAQILLPLCDMLWKAHSIGLVHRDIKPDNIFLHHEDGEEIVKIVDFGIAKLIQTDNNADNADLTETGNIIGTPTYMAPERFDTDKPYDGHSDIYSLGITLYQMLSGTVPFHAESHGMGGIARLILQHLRETPPPLRQLNPKIPEEIEKVVMRTLSKDPMQRPNAKELAIEFAAALSIELEMHVSGAFNFNLSEIVEHQ